MKFTVSDYKRILAQMRSVEPAGFASYAFWRFAHVSVYRFMLFMPTVPEKEGFCRRAIRCVSAVWIALATLVLERFNLDGMTDAHGKTILFFSDFYANRKDMRQTLQTVCDSSDELLAVHARKTKRFAPNPFYLLLTLRWLAQLRAVDVPTELRGILLRMLANAYLFRKCLDRNAETVLTANALISLNDENFDENLFVQFCQGRGMPTATLQHGHFWNTKDSEEPIYYAHNFKELTADYFFAWGQYTCDLAVRDGVPPDRMIPVGIPKYIGQTEKLPMRRENVFGVFFDTPASGTKYNVKLAEYANFLSERYGYSFYVKLHPADSAERYNGIFNPHFLGFSKQSTVREFTETIDFSLVCTSTVFFEQIFFGKPVFRYLPPASIDVYEGLTFSAFSDETQLREAVELFRTDEAQYLKRLQEMTDYCCGKGDIAENYRSAIHRLNEKGMNREERTK